ncbi:MAG: ribonuclease III [Christensenellales bacterium]
MEEVEKIINYEFKNKSLLLTALTHSSYAHKHKTQNNERLEFLGDSIIGFLIAEYLYQKLDLKEGELTKIRAKIVSCENLSLIVTKSNLFEYIKTMPENLKNNETIKGDFFEALLGAIYLDGGLENAKKFVFEILKLNNDELKKYIEENTDFKTRLQEIVQAKRGVISYRVVNESGKSNEMIFTVGLLINEIEKVRATGTSKQKAENECARIALEKIDKLFD